MADRHNPMDDYPVGTWIPHRRETWPWRYALLQDNTKFQKWNGHGAAPEFTEYWLPAGTQVKIVMVSRLGDVGITPHLEADRGYDARVFLDALEQIADKKA